jgi:acyl transferase domain-containing protein
MASVLASQEQVRSLLADKKLPQPLGGVEIAAINGPNSTVLSGERSALASVIMHLEANGLKVKQLNVSHAFHSTLMEPMLGEFEQVARSIQFHTPNIEFISTVIGQGISTEIATPDYWVNQIRQPVQFMAAMLTVADANCTTLLELGPRSTLLSMGQSCVSIPQAAWLPSLVCSGGNGTQTSGDASKDTSKIEWQTILTSLGKLYEGGHRIDWASVERGYRHKKVPIPNYPFQRKRYWIDAPANNSFASAQALSAQYHPLLGQRLPIAGNTVRGYEVSLEIDVPLQWGDHRVFQSALLPAAASLEMALAAGYDIFHHSYCLENISLLKGCWIDEDAATHLQTLLTRQSDEVYRFEIHQFDQSLSTQNTLTQSNASPRASIQQTVGTLKRVSDIIVPAIDVTAIRQKFTDTLSSEEFYRQYSQQGIDYGTSFQIVQTVWRGQAEALAQIGMVADEANLFQMHPVLLDAGLQVAGATLEAGTQGTYLPISIERFQLYNPISCSSYWVYATRRDAELRVDITWLSDQHQVIAVLQGLTLQMVDANQVLENRPQPVSSSVNWFYQVTWKSEPLLPTAAEVLVKAESIGDRLIPSFTQQLQSPSVLTYQALQPSLNELARAYIFNALSQLGLTRQLSNGSTTEELTQLLGVIPQHHQFLERCLGILEEQGHVSHVGNQWQIHSVTAPSIDIHAIHQPLSQYEGLDGELCIMRRCGEQLAEVLLGQVDPLSLLFPDGDLTPLTQLYQTSVGAHVMNQLVQDAVLTAVSSRSADQPTTRPLRILEIGAGTGGTTAHLLPALSNVQQSVTYVFTDISPRFITAAQTRVQEFPVVE